MNREPPHDPQITDRSSLSHALRTPLAVARGYAELTRRRLMRRDPDLHALMEMNTRLHDQLLRLEAVIREYLDTD